MAKKSSTIASFTQDQKAWLNQVISENKPVTYIETGNVGLDLALTDGKGLPMGSSTLFWAKPGSGKTTVVVDTSKRLIKKFKGTDTPFKVLYLAVEDSRGLMTALGMDEYIESEDFLYVSNRLCWRQVEMLYEAVLSGQIEKYKDVKLIVIDSINNVLSDQNVKNSAADGDYGTKARERSAFYSKILPLCKEKGAILILDDYAELAAKLDIDGVHLGKNDMPPQEARNLIGEKYIIGGTANTIDDIKNLVAQGVDYIGLGPFRHTDTKKNLSPILGLDGYKNILSQCNEAGITTPIVAIGGIEPEDIPALMKTGISGVALSGTILRADHPAEATQNIITTLNNL
jgi:thiamine-phosphate pyrophosphorylase